MATPVPNELKFVLRAQLPKDQSTQLYVTYSMTMAQVLEAIADKRIFNPHDFFLKAIVEEDVAEILVDLNLTFFHYKNVKSVVVVAKSQLAAAISSRPFLSVFRSQPSVGTRSESGSIMH